MCFETGGETGDETWPCGWDARFLYLPGLYLHHKGLARDFEKFETKPFLSVILHSPTPPTDLPKSNSITPIRRAEFAGAVRETLQLVSPLPR